LKIINTLLFAAISIIFISPALAQTWTGQGEAGLVKASGNTTSENINVGLNFKNEGERFVHEFDFDFYKASSIT